MFLLLCFIRILNLLQPAGTKTAPDKLKPTIEWQKIQVSDFSEVRSDLTKILVMLMKTGKMETKAKAIKIGDDTLEGWKVFFENNDPTLSCALGLKPDKLVRGLEMLVEILEEVEPGQTVDHKTGKKTCLIFFLFIFYFNDANNLCCGQQLE